MSGAESLGPTSRFTDRVGAYVRSRPSYPPALFRFLREDLGLRPHHTIVEVGSGTGILTGQLLALGNRVVAVEPNDAMREAAESALAVHDRFVSVAGSAEDTGLDDEAADFVVAGQAFHWFDEAASARELGRILKRRGWAILVWNHRRLTGTPFLEAYEAFLDEWGTDYAAVAERHANRAALATFFRDGKYGELSFPNVQALDEQGLLDRFISSSYLPGPGHREHAAMVAAAMELFGEHQRGGSVSVEYDTLTYWGHI